MKQLIVIVALLLSNIAIAQYPCLLCPDDVPDSYNTVLGGKGSPGTDIEENTVPVCMYGICEAVYSRLINAGRKYVAMPIGNGRYAYYRKWEFYDTLEEAKSRLYQMKRSGTIKKDAYVREIYGMVTFQ